MQDSMFIELDVYKATFSVAVAQGERGGEDRQGGTISHRPDHVRKLVEKLGVGGRRLHFCDEARPCGYGLHRQLVELGHPLREIRQIVNDALASLDAEFDALYTKKGRPLIAPERLTRASLLQMLFSILSERQLIEQMDYNLLLRWLVGLGIDDPVWFSTVFTKNRDRLLTTDMSRKVMAAILAHPEVKPPLSDEHFSVDGTLVKAWASMKSFQPKDGAPPDRDDDPGDPPPPPPAQETSVDTDHQPQ